MDFDLSAEQVALRDAAKALLDDRCDMAAVRRACDDGGFDAGLWQAMVDQGWTGIAVPEALGGVGLGTVEAAVLLEQTGAHLAPAPLAQQLVALAAGPWGERLVSGEAVACVARTPLERAGDGTVSGRPEPVVYGARADVLVAPAGDELVAVDLAGVPRSPEPAMDQTRELAWIDLDGGPAVTVGGTEEVAAHLDRGGWRVYRFGDLVPSRCQALQWTAPVTRVAVFIDYQNIYHGARRAFGSNPSDLPHFGHVDPLALARLLVGLGHPADPERVLWATNVYRGEPGRRSHRKLVTAFGRQTHRWRADPSVTVRTTPLRYRRVGQRNRSRSSTRSIMLGVLTSAGNPSYCCSIFHGEEPRVCFGTKMGVVRVPSAHSALRQPSAYWGSCVTWRVWGFEPDGARAPFARVALREAEAPGPGLLHRSGPRQFCSHCVAGACVGPGGRG